MKKMLFGLMVVACAVCVQAASVNWVVSNVKTPADSSVAGAGYSMYLFLTETTGSQATTTVSAVTDAIAAGTFDSSTAVNKGTLSSAGAISGDAGLGGAWGAGDSLSGFAVIFDGDYDSVAGGSYIVTGVKSASFTSSTGAKSLAFGSQATATWTTYGGGDIPEPTSGLLLLVGGAMLALRRKQK